MRQVVEPGWAGDTTQGPVVNKTKHSHLPPPKAHGSLQPPLFPSSLHTLLAHPADQLGSDTLSALLPLGGLGVTQSTDEEHFRLPVAG